CRTTSSSLSSGSAGLSAARCPLGMMSSRGRSGTSAAGKTDVARPGRLVSKSRGGWSSLYMRALYISVGRGEAVDFRARPFFGHGDEDRVGQIGVPAAQGDAAVVAQLANIREHSPR